MQSFQSVLLNDDDIELVRGKVREHMKRREEIAEDDRKRQTTRLKVLTDKRGKLMQAYYANAIPLDVLSAEQERINGEITDAESVLAKCSTKFEEIEETLEYVLWLARHCAESYALAPDLLRRMINQALFTEIYVDEDKGTGAVQIVRRELTEPFAAVAELAGRPVPSPLNVATGAENTRNTKTSPEGLILGHDITFF